MDHTDRDTLDERTLDRETSALPPPRCGVAGCGCAATVVQCPTCGATVAALRARVLELEALVNEALTEGRAAVVAAERACREVAGRFSDMEMDGGGDDCGVELDDEACGLVAYGAGLCLAAIRGVPVEEVQL